MGGGRQNRRLGAAGCVAGQIPETSPRNSVIFAVVAGAAPERAVLLIEVDGSDGAGVLFHEIQRVAHPRQFPSHPRRHFVRERHAARLGLVFTERTAHLVAGDVGCLARLLHGHAELDDVEEELQQVLVLGIATLNGPDSFRHRGDPGDETAAKVQMPEGRKMSCAASHSGQ